MINNIKLACSLAIVLVLTGCASVTESGYYWGNYSETYYQYIKAPSEQSVTNHLNELNEIVEVSRQKNLKVPPGIYAELGYITVNRGNDKEGMDYYRQEAELYPESSAFIERLISDKQKKEI